METYIHQNSIQSFVELKSKNEKKNEWTLQFWYWCCNNKYLIGNNQHNRPLVKVARTNHSNWGEKRWKFWRNKISIKNNVDETLLQIGSESFSISHVCYYCFVQDPLNFNSFKPNLSHNPSTFLHAAESESLNLFLELAINKPRNIRMLLPYFRSHCFVPHQLGREIISSKILTTTARVSKSQNSITITKMHIFFWPFFFFFFLLS